MSGGVDSLGFGPVLTSQQQRRAAAVHVADRIAAEHPHPLDDQMPKLAGRLIGRDPHARQELVDLLDVLGLAPANRRRAA